MIVAAAENDVIGRADGNLPWHLPSDFAYFKAKTSGHPIIMGRKTYEAIGRPLPGRLNIVITHNKDYGADGCIVVDTLGLALQRALTSGADEAFVIGGGSIYAAAEPLADKLYLTRVHANPEGTTFFEYDESAWVETAREEHKADDKNEFDYSFITLARSSDTLKSL